MPMAHQRSVSSTSQISGWESNNRNGNASFIRSGPKDHPTPLRFHTLEGQASILTLLISESKIFAGTQDGDLIVWSLRTYELLATIHAHRGSLLSLSISSDQTLLFSSGCDALVNVWDAKSFKRLYSIFSNYNIGDVFCVAYSSLLQTVYLGAQNTSIQWYDLSKKDLRPAPELTSHPSHRNDRFFDSKGPGGISTPRSSSADELLTIGGQDLDIDKDHIVQYAHHGYVYCMLLAGNLNNRKHRGETLISAGGDGTVKLWALDSSQDGAIVQQDVLENGDESVLTLALDGSLLYSGRLEGDINVWHLDTCQLISTVRAHPEDVLTLSVGHDLIFTGSSDGAAKIFNHRHTEISGWRAHKHLILASAITSVGNKNLYITGGNDGCITVWDISNHVEKPSKGKITSNEDLVLALEEFVAYQTVSSRPQYASDCRQGASFLLSLFKQFGAKTDLLFADEEMNPVVFARFRANSSQSSRHKTILFYGHYDIVSADNKTANWKSEPFALQAVNGYLYGRGSSDNKGPVLAALYAVADAIKTGSLSADVVFLIEGEEESGSRGFRQAIHKHQKLIGEIDWILLANSYWLTDEIPCLTYGLRGIVRITIEIMSERPDLHSGVDGSHQLNEAMKDMVAVLASLTDEDGRVSIPCFYDRIPRVSSDEERHYDTICHILLQQNPNIGEHENLKASLKAKWREPSLTIHRVQHSGPASSSIIPRTVKADVSVRLVPRQTTDEIFEGLRKHLELSFEDLQSSNQISVKKEHQAEPWLGDPSNHLFQILDAAIKEAWGPLMQHQQSTKTMTTEGKNRRASVKVFHDSTNSPKSPPLTSAILATAKPPMSPTGAENRRQTTSQSVIAEAQQQIPLYIREGGTIPAIRFLEQEFNAPAAHLPCGQASDSAHLDNERLRLLNLYKGREIFRKVFTDLGKV